MSAILSRPQCVQWNASVILTKFALLAASVIAKWPPPVQQLTKIPKRTSSRKFRKRLYIGNCKTGKFRCNHFTQIVIFPFQCNYGWYPSNGNDASFHHWLNWKLSFWQLPVQPLTKHFVKMTTFPFQSYCICSPSGLTGGATGDVFLISSTATSFSLTGSFLSRSSRFSRSSNMAGGMRSLGMGSSSSRRLVLMPSMMLLRRDSFCGLKQWKGWVWNTECKRNADKE